MDPDEDLHENPFLKHLQKRFKKIYDKVESNKLTLCIPASGTVVVSSLTEDDIESHVLMTTSGDIRTLNGKSITANGNTLSTSIGFKTQRSARVLFEETNYTARGDKFKLLCISEPLQGALSKKAAAARIPALTNLEQAVAFLRKNASKSLRAIAPVLDSFNALEGPMSRSSLLDGVTIVHTRCMQAVQQDAAMKAFMRLSQRHHDYVALAVETYVLDRISKRVISRLTSVTAEREGLLRTALSQYTPPLDQPGLGNIPAAAEKLKASNIVAQTTPLERTASIDAVCALLVVPPAQGQVLAADDVIPLLCVLLARTAALNIPWHATLTYCRDFRLSGVHSERSAYNLSSIEAAIAFLTNATPATAAAASAARTRSISNVSNVSGNSFASEPQVHENKAIEQLFHAIDAGNLVLVGNLLGDNLMVAADTEKTIPNAISPGSPPTKPCDLFCMCPLCDEFPFVSGSPASAAGPARDRKVSVFSRDRQGRTALHYAAFTGQHQILQLLLQLDSTVDAVDNNGQTALHLACAKDHVLCAMLLLQERAHINAVDTDGNTPLHVCCRGNNERVVKSLLFWHTPPDLNLTNARGDTPLHLASQHGFGAIVVQLLNYHADVTIRNIRGQTPVQAATNPAVRTVLRHYEESGEVLDSLLNKATPSSSPALRVELKAPPRAKDSESQNKHNFKLLLSAIEDDDIELFKFRLGDMCHPLCQCERCQGAAVSLVVQSPGLLSAADDEGRTCLHMAVLLGRVDVVAILLDRRAPIEARTNLGLTPLHLACQYNRVEILKMLIAAGANVDELDHAGNTPTHIACASGHAPCVDAMLRNGAEVNIINERGDTPLHNAARWSSVRAVESLLMFGAHTEVVNKQNKTPYQLTANEDIRRLLTSGVPCAPFDIVLVSGFRDALTYVGGRYFECDPPADVPPPCFRKAGTAPRSAGVHAGRRLFLFFIPARAVWAVSTYADGTNLIAYATGPPSHPKDIGTTWNVAGEAGGYMLDLNVDVALVTPQTTAPPVAPPVSPAAPPVASRSALRALETVALDTTQLLADIRAFNPQQSLRHAVARNYTDVMLARTASLIGIRNRPRDLRRATTIDLAPPSPGRRSSLDPDVLVGTDAMAVLVPDVDLHRRLHSFSDPTRGLSAVSIASIVSAKDEVLPAGAQTADHSIISELDDTIGAEIADSHGGDAMRATPDVPTVSPSLISSPIRPRTGTPTLLASTPALAADSEPRPAMPVSPQPPRALQASPRPLRAVSPALTHSNTTPAATHPLEEA
eukprot:m.141278 g.141278  ORF g.141278 m.141278 type:complete len:1270 (+) comp9634_c0_seq3:96-3905(+)